MKINLIANLNGALMGLSFGSEHEITLGRENGNTIAPLTADGLSRRHAKLFFKDGAWYVEDLGSMNGTYLMGVKVEAPTKLEAKNVLQLGSFKMTVDEILEESAPAKPAAATETVFAPVSPAPAPAPAAKPVAPVAELKPVEPLAPVAELKPVSPVAPITPAKPARPVLKPAIKLPTAVGAAKPGVRLPVKPVAKLPPKA